MDWQRFLNDVPNGLSDEQIIDWAHESVVVSSSTLIPRWLAKNKVLRPQGILVLLDDFREATKNNSLQDPTSQEAKAKILAAEAQRYMVDPDFENLDLDDHDFQTMVAGLKQAFDPQMPNLIDKVMADIGELGIERKKRYETYGASKFDATDLAWCREQVKWQTIVDQMIVEQNKWQERNAKIGMLRNGSPAPSNLEELDGM